VAPAPLAAGEFAGLVEALGPWPARPALAVALSGGRDSLALALLLRDWVAARQGRLLALTVDHRLRPASAEEAAWVAEVCRNRGIPHRILAWDRAAPPVPGRPVQEAARRARYALLQAACREAGIAFLCTAHQAGDQRETLLLRLRSGSGPLGLAAMSRRRALQDVVLLRPLLGVPRERLAATLESLGQGWRDDPSNDDTRHRRVALRGANRALDDAGLTAARLDEAASLFGRLRTCLERAAARLLAQASAWHPAGYARLDAALLAAAPAPVARLALGEIVRALGGGEGWRPGEAALDRALAKLAPDPAPDPAPDRPPRGFTLAGLRFLRRAGTWLALPEARRLPSAPLVPGARLRWGAFVAEVAAGAPPGLRLEPLGQAAWPALAAELGRAPLPGPVLWVQPAVRDARGLLALPTLGWRREAGANPLLLRFNPEAPAGAFGFTVAWRERHII